MEHAEPTAMPAQESFRPERLQRIDGYHLINERCTLGNDDDRSVTLGERVEMSYAENWIWDTRLDNYVKITGDITQNRDGLVPKLCKRGMHGSPTIYEALSYHTGPLVTRVVGEVDVDYDDPEPGYTGERKWSARFRTITAGPVHISELANRAVIDLKILTPLQVKRLDRVVAGLTRSNFGRHPDWYEVRAALGNLTARQHYGYSFLFYADEGDVTGYVKFDRISFRNAFMIACYPRTAANHVVRREYGWAYRIDGYMEEDRQNVLATTALEGVFLALCQEKGLVANV